MRAVSGKSRSLFALLIALLVALLGACGGASRQSAANSRDSATAVRPERTGPHGLPAVTVDQLPAEARKTLRLIDAGGPFPYARDGSVFGNREGLLPPRPRGYYREYTVITPGSADRGARRIVAGRGGERYYTPDHYRTFYEVVRR